MAFEVPLLRHTYPAGADLSGSDLTDGVHPQSGGKGGGNYRAVALGNDGRVTIAAAGDPIIGILQNRPLENEAAAVEHAGISFAVIGAAIANAGTALQVGTDGQLIVTAAGTTVARLLEPASGAGSVCAVQILPGA